jgi:hypothetical protein
VPVVTDAEGALIAGWQQRGQGRVAVWTLANSFALVLGGQQDRYAQWWSQTLSAVTRPDAVFRPDVPALLAVGERAAICGIAADARVIAPGSAEVALAIDPEAGPRGCAAYWPKVPGEHRIVQTGQSGEQVFAFLVLDRAALRSIRANETGAATARWAAEQSGAAARSLPERRSAAWPYALAWLVLSGALWFAERRLRRHQPLG